MTTCTCRTCSCSEEEIAAYRAATSPLQQAVEEFEQNQDEGVKSYDIDAVKGRVFYGSELNECLAEMCEWLKQVDGTLAATSTLFDDGWIITAFADCF